ncbi:MAG: cupin domain-containing protein [Ignavibacteriae bacterium]|nr:cupin domain-containing protein [Ignavibacteriota bacterium]
MKDYIVNTNNTEWKQLYENGINTNGLYFKVLRFDETTNRPPSFLLKFDAGAKYPYHNHPGGEEVFVLEGSVFFNDTELFAGDYLYTPKNFKHSVHSENGCVLLFNVPEEVEIIYNRESAPINY